MSKIRLSMQPQGFRSLVKFNLQGHLLFHQLFRHLGKAKTTGSQTRDLLQKTASKHLLNHLEVRLEIRGLQHVGQGPFLIAPLHEGIADAIALAQLPIPMRFVVRDEIFTWPQIGPAVQNLGHIPINPEQGLSSYRNILRNAPAVLEQGESIVVFPQGCLLGIEAAFQRGAFSLCKTLNLPMLPVVITGTHRIWEHPFASSLRYRQKVFIEVLEPIPAQAFKTNSLEALRLQVQRQMKQIALKADLPSPRRYVPERDGWQDGYRFDIDPDFAEVYARVKSHRQNHPTQIVEKRSLGDT